MRFFKWFVHILKWNWSIDFGYADKSSAKKQMGLQREIF